MWRRFVITSYSIHYTKLYELVARAPGAGGVGAGRVEKDVTVERPGRPPQRWSESVRLYERDELV